MSHRIHPFCSDVILMRFVSSSFQPWSRALVGINNTSVFCLAFSNIAVSPLLFIGILQGIAAGIGTSNFLRAAFIVSLNSSSSGSLKNILFNCLALSSFGFSISHLCFPFFFDASDICFHISGHTLSGREVVCFLVSLLPDHVPAAPGLRLMFSDTLHLLQFFNVRDHNVSFPDSTRVQRITEKYTWQDFCSKLMLSRKVLRRNRVILDHCSKRYCWSVKGHPVPPFTRCLPVRQEILNVSQIAAAFHRIRPPFVS